MILRGNVFSHALEMDTGITIITPSDYKPQGAYQVAYVLHGLCGNNANFADHTMLPVYANKRRCIFVMPEVGRSFYTDMVYGQNYFSYIAKELPQICRSVFNISANRDDTFVIGASMGGYGALKCALTYPNQYGACCALSSGALFLKDFLSQMKESGDTPEFIAAWGRQFINDFRAAFGEGFTWKPEAELLELAKQIDPVENAPRIYSTCGAQDGMLELNRKFVEQMKRLSFDIVYEERPGNHDWYFFNDALKKALDFCFRSSR